MTIARRIADFVPAALVYAVITILSQQSSFPVDEPFPGFDKIFHFAEFAILGFALAFGFFRRKALAPGGRLFRESAFLWSIGAGLGLLDEFHQVFVPGRNADLADAAADALGIGLGIGLFVVLRRRRSRL
jgi:VanZ family protein